MEELRATRGPYKVDVRVGCLAVYPANEYHDCLAGIDKTAVHYAHGEQTKGEDGMIHWTISEEKIANAHLLAASWEMYEALKVVARFLEELNDGWPGEELVRKTLAKARGEAT